MDLNLCHGTKNLYLSELEEYRLTGLGGVSAFRKTDSLSNLWGIDIILQKRKTICELGFA